MTSGNIFGKFLHSPTNLSLLPQIRMLLLLSPHHLLQILSLPISRIFSLRKIHQIQISLPVRVHKNVQVHISSPSNSTQLPCPNSYVQVHEISLTIPNPNPPIPRKNLSSASPFVSQNQSPNPSSSTPQIVTTSKPTDKGMQTAEGDQIQPFPLHLSRKKNLKMIKRC